MKNTAMKNSVFTNGLTRALKRSKSDIRAQRLHCNVDAEGTVYICNGYFIARLTAAEYEEFARPVTQRDPGHWALTVDGQATGDPMDLVRYMEDAAREAAHTIAAAPMRFDLPGKDKTQMVGFYSIDGDFVTTINAKYADMLNPGLSFKGSRDIGPVVVYSAGFPVAMILPVNSRRHPETIRAIRAWFDAAPAADNSGSDQSDELRRQIEELRAALAAKDEQLKALSQQRDAQPTQSADDKPQNKAAALVEKLSSLPNVTAAVKGAQTTAPVVWLSGDTDPHKTEIEKLGGRWSGKRAAWYFKIA